MKPSNLLESTSNGTTIIVKFFCFVEGYAAKALKELGHIFPKKYFYGPSDTMTPTYGSKYNI